MTDVATAVIYGDVICDADVSVGIRCRADVAWADVINGP